MSKDLHSQKANSLSVKELRVRVGLLVPPLGLNQAWQMNQDKVSVDIAERIVMTPFTAKRLAIMLSATLRAYEAKYGKIDIGLNETSNQSTGKQNV